MGGGTVLQEFGQITDVDAGQGRHSAGLGDVHRAQQRPGLWLYSYGEEDVYVARSSDASGGLDGKESTGSSSARFKTSDENRSNWSYREKSKPAKTNSVLDEFCLI